jgi:hypothetical protein
MASPPNIQQLSLQPVQQQAGQGDNASQSAPSVSMATSPTTLILCSPEGIDCYGNERQVLMKQTKFFNNEALSDIILTVGGNKFYAHKFILVQCSDVFERMLSEEWSNDEKKVIYVVKVVVASISCLVLWNYILILDEKRFISPAFREV